MISEKDKSVLKRMVNRCTYHRVLETLAELCREEQHRIYIEQGLNSKAGHLWENSARAIMEAAEKVHS